MLSYQFVDYQLYPVLFAEKMEFDRNSVFLSGILKTLQESVKPYRYLQNPTGIWNSCREIAKPYRNSQNLSGKQKTQREKVKPLGNSQNPEGNGKTIREFLKPSGKTEKPTGICKTFREFAKPWRKSLFLQGNGKTLWVVVRKLFGRVCLSFWWCFKGIEWWFKRLNGSIWWIKRWSKRVER